MSASPARSPIKKQKSEGFGKVSGPFVRDTSMIIEKFVESVKDLFQHCYTDKDLYSEIHKMSEDELFANLSEYLEDIKFAIFEALSENLDKISLKFLQICDKQEKFNKYLRVLKDKWRNSSSSLKGHHRHDDKYIRSAKDFVNKLADQDLEAQRSKSRRGSRIKPQTHFSDFDAVNRWNGAAGTSAKSAAKNRPQAAQPFSTLQDMPLTGAKPEKTASSKTPQKSSHASRTGQSPTRPLTNSPGKGYSSKNRPGTGQHSDDAVTRLIEKREEHAAFTRDIIDPHTGRTLRSPSHRQVSLPHRHQPRAPRPRDGQDHRSYPRDRQGLQGHQPDLLGQPHHLRPGHRPPGPPLLLRRQLQPAHDQLRQRQDRRSLAGRVLG
jgi:hypothetical protein